MVIGHSTGLDGEACTVTKLVHVFETRITRTSFMRKKFGEYVHKLETHPLCCVVL